MKDQLLVHIIDNCRKGDRVAQTELYKRYYKGMYSVSYRILNHSAEAEDAMQEAFISAFKQLDSFRGEVTFGSWLKKIVVNRSIDLLRKRKIQFEELSNFSDMHESEDLENIELITAETIKTAIGQLQDNYRIVLTLFLLEGYDHDEIGSILNISNGTSRVIFHRAKEKLKNDLREIKNELIEA